MNSWSCRFESNERLRLFRPTRTPVTQQQGIGVNDGIRTHVSGFTGQSVRPLHYGHHKLFQDGGRNHALRRAGYLTPWTELSLGGAEGAALEKLGGPYGI